jgi:uncharacterized protein with PIN domain
MRCPHCDNRLIQVKEDEGKAKLRLPILVFNLEGTECTSKCPRCGGEIMLPIKIEKSAIQTGPPRFTLSKR